ncbi:MAG: hypothetical protein KF850_16575 [Labilithrix sp.]|nr:hypothetical protein [Labilithrix sp.]
MRLARSALVAFLAGSVACGLVFSPGDYGEVAPSAPDADAGPAPDAAPEGDADLPDGDLVSARVLLFAGRRAAVPGEPDAVAVAETMRTTLSPSGELGPWTFDVSPSSAAVWTRAAMVGETLLLQSSSTVLQAPLANGRFDAGWSPLPYRSSAPEGFFRGWIVSDAGMTAAGGQVEGAFTTNVYVAPFDLRDGGIEPWEESSSKLVKARGDVTLIRAGSFLYAVGGRDNGASTASGRDEVEVARFEADGGLGAFEETTRLADPAADAAAFRVLFPVTAAGAGHLFVIGGQTNASGALSDVALAAKIDVATGKLGAWVALPRLPAPMSAAAALVFGDRVLVFGGRLGEAQSDGVLALPIAPDGSFGATWEKIGTLPAPRSGLAAVVY